MTQLAVKKLFNKRGIHKTIVQARSTSIDKNQVEPKFLVS